MEEAGVRLCNDSALLLSPADLEEFVLPYDQRALEAFGGGWVHWCGASLLMVEKYLALPGCTCINQGTMPHSESHFDPHEVMPAVLAADKVYYGIWPPWDGESLRAYFDRILDSLQGEKRGLLLILEWEGVTPAQAMEEWRAAHQRAGLAPEVDHAL
jgi:hypothetical protein